MRPAGHRDGESQLPPYAIRSLISIALLGFVADCNRLLLVCRPLLSGANECELSARPQRELRKRRILDSPLRDLEPLRLGLGSHGRVRRRYTAAEEFQVPANRVDFSSAFGIGGKESEISAQKEPKLRNPII